MPWREWRGDKRSPWTLFAPQVQSPATTWPGVEDLSFPTFSFPTSNWMYHSFYRGWPIPWGSKTMAPLLSVPSSYPPGQAPIWGFTTRPFLSSPIVSRHVFALASRGRDLFLLLYLHPQLNPLSFAANTYDSVLLPLLQIFPLLWLGRNDLKLF